MKFEKKLKQAYDKLPLPEAEKVLPSAGSAGTEAPVRRVRRMRWIPIVAVAAAVCVLVSLLAASFLSDGPAPLDDGTSAPAGDVSKSGYDDGVIGGRTDTSRAGDYSTPYDEEYKYWGDGKILSGTGIDVEWDGAAEGMGEAPAYGDKTSYLISGEPISYGDPDHGRENNEVINAGTLTAGEWRDVKNLEEWLKKFSDDPEWLAIEKSRKLYALNVAEVRVTNGGDPVFNEKVTLYYSDGSEAYSARTDVNGFAYLCWKQDKQRKIGAVKAGGAEAEVAPVNGIARINLDTAATGNKPEQLDLMFMIDTTGSMGDELSYIAAELSDMIGRIAESGDSVSIRVSVNFYRDEGDDYVVKYYDFRTDISECIEQIQGERVDGGGDYPEAVHTALDNAINGHNWRDEAVKLCYFVLDAPPHSENEVPGVNDVIVSSIEKAAAAGIRVIPVASSGVDTETEVILRSFAVMTGGTYVFLTDHSGIGGSHLEASVGDYEVEPLNECLIRIACEYCGLEYEAKYKYEPKPAETEFGFRLVWNVYGISSYDSRSGSLVKTDDPANGDLDRYATTMFFSAEELKEIEKLLTVDINLGDYPDSYDPFNDPDSETKILSAPDCTLIVEIFSDGKLVKSVTCRNVILGGVPEDGYDEAAKAFLTAFGKVVGMITGTDEWRQLPTPEVIYE